MTDRNFIVFKEGSFVFVRAFKHEGHARNFVKNRNAKYSSIDTRGGYDYLPVAKYNTETSKTVTKRNLLSGKEIQVAVGTPACCDPSTETYWSM